MDTSFRSLVLLFSTLALALQLTAAPRSELWQQVTEAEENRLPKSAITVLDTIIADATDDGSYAEAIKAISRKIALETNIQGQQPEESILRLQSYLDDAPPELRPTFQALLAHSYWNYFQQNRYRFLQRTQTAETPSDDFRTWDLARILHEVDKRFTAALDNEAFLQAIPIESYDSFLEPGTVPNAYRPTLYDFLAHQALSFYKKGEQGVISVENPFEISADSPIFADNEQFLAWHPKSPDSYSPEYKAIQLYQKLLRFHQADSDPSALYDIELDRLNYAYNTAFGEDKSQRYTDSLDRFIENTQAHEISARARAKLATHYFHQGNSLLAHQIASQALQSFPQSVGTLECTNLINRIESKSAAITTESVWNASNPKINVSYANVDAVYFRAIKADLNNEILSKNRVYDRRKLLSKRPNVTWQADLPPTLDFKPRTEEFPAPDDLTTGLYHILASYDPTFTDTENRVSHALVWVSDLALVLRTQESDTPLHGFVLNAISGEPIEDAVIEIWRQNRRDKFKQTGELTTDKNGRFKTDQSNRNDRTIIVARHNGQTIANLDSISPTQRYEPNQSITQTVFFTDRALYRPGQSINYKGIAIKTRHSNSRYETIPNSPISVVFKNPNGQEIARQEYKTNDYGSFSGTFTAPTQGLMGSMRISVEERHHGSAYFNVEEYKRPKFIAELSPPQEAPKLDETVTLTGKATAYTGSAIGGATVSWRVERAAQAPIWCWWWEPTSIQSIAHGTAETNAGGTFSIQFPATPDQSIPRTNEPVFEYKVIADVTDSSGETRSTQTSLRVGYTALQANISTDSWLSDEEPVQLTLSTSTLNGTPQASKNTLTLFALREPTEVIKQSIYANTSNYISRRKYQPDSDPSNPDTWDTAAQLSTETIRTDKNGNAQFSTTLPAGAYRAKLETKDRFGETVTAQHTFFVASLQADHFSTKIPFYQNTATPSVEPGETYQALWATGYESGRAFIEIAKDGKTLQSYWTDPSTTQTNIQFPITEEHRGGLSLRTTFVRENRVYSQTDRIHVPWTNKQLSIKWERFRSKLEPGQKETWTATITGPDAQKAAAEMVVTLYDASLDQFKQHNWPQQLGTFRYDYNNLRSSFVNITNSFQYVTGTWNNHHYQNPIWSYRSFPPEILSYYGNEEVFELSSFGTGAPNAALRSKKPRRPNPMDTIMMADSAPKLEMALTAGKSGPQPPPPPVPDLSQVAARSNLAETAFFYPHLLGNEDGEVKITFTLPDTLTKWRFLGFAHDNELRSGFITDTAVTAKDLMVEANPPRFLREGDEIEFTVKVSNQSEETQNGTVRLTFSDAATLAPADDSLQNRKTDRSFKIPAKQSKSITWRIKVPDTALVLTYKAVGATDTLSDGEEGYLPVLSRRILVTESLPLPIRDAGSKEFTFDKLLASADSDTLQHQSLTVQMVSQPAWYAIMALPYLMEFQHECSEQLFSRYYANVLGAHIAHSDPKIRRVFDLWKNTDALDSPLEKNQDLKSVLIEETPWLRQAKSESQSRRNVGLLFDANRLSDESTRALQKLAERQLNDGRWSWFPGGRGSDYITLHIATGFARLRQLGVEVDPAPALRSLRALDRWANETYKDILDQKQPAKYIPGNTIALYLYGRSFYLQDQPLNAKHRKAVDFFLKQARKHWTKVGSRQSEAHLALALQRFGDHETAAAIMKSLKERSILSEEFGRYWADNGPSWWWYHAPIETQALMIEAFAEITQDIQAVEDLKVWLLKQKQTQNWKTTKATADAVYALLLRGQNLLTSDALVSISLGGETIEPEKVEAGTGFYQKTFIREEIRPEMGAISVTKTDDGISWGSAHWQYLEDMSKITPHEDTPLTLKKTLFVKENTASGPVLKPISGQLSVGDELVVRLELRTDRDMEYLHLKDQRGSGTEPVNVLSQYKYQDGLGYYESTRDTASHFYIDYLRKGTYVFEYSTRVQLKGSYQSGIAEIQCMYAPEFNSHSESTQIEVN